MIIHVLLLFRKYYVLFHLFGDRKKGKKISRKQMLIFNPLILCLISWGIYIIKTTASKINKQSRDCPSEPLTKLIREIDFILMGSIVINGVYFLISLLLTVASLILKRCRKSDEQLSSDEQDE